MKGGNPQGTKFGAKLASVFFSFVLAFSMIPTAPAVADAGSGQGPAGGGLIATSLEAAANSGSQLTAEADAQGPDAEGAGGVQALSVSPSAAAATGVTYWDDKIDLGWYVGHESDTSYEIGTPAQLAGLAYLTSPLSRTTDEYSAWADGTSKLSAASANAKYSTVEVADFAGKTVKLTADIDMQGSESRVTKPIADINNLTPGAGGQGGSGGTLPNVAWKGTFDGQGHTVSNVYIDWRSLITANYGGYQGMFSAVADGAVIQKVGVTGTIYGRVIGGIAAVSRFSGDQKAVETYPLIQNSWTDVNTTGNGSGSRPTGGIFGGESERSDWCNIVNCYAKGTAHNGQSGGGIAGFLNGTIAGCYASGKVTAPNNTGTIVATLYKPGSETGSITSANGFYGTNAAIEGVDPNGNAYRYLDGTGGNPIEVKTGLIKASDLQGKYYFQYLHNSSLRNASTAEGYVQGTAEVNDGYPLLYWQAESQAAEVDLSGATITAIPDQTYTSKPIEPALTVKLGTTTLYQGNDFIAKWEDNVNVSTEQSKAKVTLYGVGRYTGHTQTTEFNIAKMDISDVTATLQAEHFWRYGEPVAPAVTVKKGTATLVKGRDYDLKYEDNDAAGKGKVSVVSLKDAEGNDLQVGTGPTCVYYITDASASLAGSGTASDPYQLKDRKDLQFLAHQVDLQSEDYLGKCYQVVSDIDCTPGENEAYNQTIGYYATPIKPFRGTFDGNGKDITLAIDQESRWATTATQVTYNSADSALFGAVGFPAAASADYSDVTTIKNLTLSGTVNGKGSRTAAFVGYHAYNSLSIEKCVNEAPIASATASAGFIVQTFGAVSVKDSTNKGAITVSGNGNAAGFLQSSSTAATVPGGLEFIGCRNEGDITTAGATTAGIVATGSPNATLSIVRCSNSGDITSTTGTTTAKSGSMLATTIGASNLVVIDSCYNTGDITYEKGAGNQSMIGGIVGEPGNASGANFVSVVNCYNKGNVTEGGTSRDNMFVGGLAGKVYSVANNAAAGPTFVTGYDTGNVAASSKNNPGFAVGAHSATTVDESDDTHAAVTVKVLGLDTLNLEAVGWEQYSARYPKVINESEKVTSDQLKGTDEFTHNGASTTTLDYLGSAFVTDSTENPVNGGYPILYWQAGETAYDIGEATAEPIPAQQATGSALTPALDLSYNGTKLVSGMDYAVRYSNNTNAGTATATVVGLGRFGGSSKTLTFKINGIQLTGSNTAISGLVNAVYTGDEVTQTPTVTYTPEGGKSKTLRANTDYTVEYTKNVNAGTASIFIEGAGIYEGTVRAAFEIAPAMFDDVVIGGVESVYEDTGSPAAVTPTLTNAAGNGMTANVDYTWQIVDKNGQETTAASAGNYTAVFTPKSGGNYAGDSRSVEFDVGTYLTVYRQVGVNGTPRVAKTYTHASFAELKCAESEGNPVSGMYYKGGAWMVTSSDNYVLLDDLIADAGLEGDWQKGASISYGGDPLQGKQTQVFGYEKFKGMDRFFPKTSGASFDEGDAVNAPAVLTLTEHSSTSSSTLSCGKVQEENLANANRANEPRLIYGVNLDDMKADPSTWGGETTRGMRYWSSNEQVTVIVPGVDISGAVIEGVSDATYTGNAIEPSVKVKLDGDYLDEAAYSVSYKNNTDAGDAEVVVTGKGSYEGTATAAFKISPASIASAAVTLSKTSYTYSGGVQKPTVKSVKLGSKTLGTGDYTASYSNASSKNAGTYKVTVKGKGNYTGTVSKAASYQIAQASQSLSATGKTATYKASALKKKAATLKRASSVTLKGAKTTVTYKLVGVTAAKYKKYFSVASKSGDITLKKGLPKGTYKLSVSATASKTVNYKSASKSYTVTVKVK